MTNLTTTALAMQAAHYLLKQKAIPVTHAAGWSRDGFPLPIKRMTADANGETTQEYRPMAILEYVQEVLSGEIAARQARDRNALEKKEAAA
jgi:hypothetical protein